MSSAKTSLALIAFALAAAACASTPSAEKEAELAMKAAMRPASPEERAAANRADPLTRANFWAKENNKNAEDLEVALEFARALREIGSHDRAIDVLSRTLIVHPRATEVAPDRSETWAALGTTYDRQGQHRLAQTSYLKALEIEPLRTTTLTNYGLSLVLTGDLTGAEAKLRLAAANPDAGARVTENLALVLGLQGKFEDMKSVSGAGAPDDVVDQNVQLLRGLIQPARSWEALADAPKTAQVAETAAAEDEGPKRTLRQRN
ncbi:MAG: hypothetical protein MUE84_07960 [Hyphomonas sp.]|nr:hypothetical protein [Hyphomonas sp.]